MEYEIQDLNKDEKIALEQNYVLVDNGFAEMMNKNKLDSKVRFTLDAFAFDTDAKKYYICEVNSR